MTWLTYLAVRPSADLLAVSSSTGWLGVWMPTDNRIVATQALDGFVNKIAWTVDGALLLATVGDRLVVMSPDGKQRVREIETGHAELRTFAVHASLVATTGGDGVVRLWDLATGACTGEVMARQGEGSGGGTALAISNDTIMVGYESGWVAFSNYKGQDVGATQIFGANIASLACLPDGSFMAGGGRGKLAQLVIEPTAWRCAETWNDPPKPYAANMIDVAPDGRFVVACSDNTACLFDGVNDRAPSRLGSSCWSEQWKQEHIVSAACFVPKRKKSKLVATSHFAGHVTLWKGISTQIVVTFDGDTPVWTSSTGFPIDDPIKEWRAL